MTPVTVCIVGFRNPDDIEGCLAALALSSHTAFDVVICENGGSAAVAALAGRIGERLSSGQSVTILPDGGNSGYAGGNNRCIDARPDAALWWILNPDTRVEPEAMARLVAVLDAGQADAVGGTLMASDGTVQAYGGRWRPLLARAVSLGKGSAFDASVADEMAPIDYILGASLMVTCRFLTAVGPMREDYFLYGEEVEWCLRARTRGMRLGLAPDARVRHAQGTTTGDGGRFGAKPRLPVYLDQRNKILILRDTTPVLVVPGAVGSLLALLGRAAKSRAWRQLGYGLSGWAAGVMNRRAIPDWVGP